MDLFISIFQDGDNDSVVLPHVLDGWNYTWTKFYNEFFTLDFVEGGNLKNNTVFENLPDKSKNIVDIRNPDIYFIENTNGIELGGIEITVHSPDGSNVEKRYPYIWGSHKNNVTSFIACPYLKTRPNGQINRLPFRHSHRNSQFIGIWNDLEQEALHQIIPTLDLQMGDRKYIPNQIKKLMFTWKDYGEFFAHLLAIKILPEANKDIPLNELLRFRKRLSNLANECKKNTNDTPPSTLFKDNKRWIQVYNVRPGVGHWERGEGQFDSIDGRLMFTLDGIDFMPKDERPSSFEFWLPQMVSSHPWILEQTERNYGSKRFRNIMVVLNQYCVVKFADTLSEADIEVLKNNSSLVLERLDWTPGTYKLTQIISKQEAKKISTYGLRGTAKEITDEIEKMIKDTTLYFGSYRLYNENWKDNLTNDLGKLPNGATILLPRIPRSHLSIIENDNELKIIIPAEECQKNHLLMLRQIHRTKSNNIKPI